MAVVFSPLLQHSEVKVEYGIPVSAGFCSIGREENAAYQTWGNSVSLKLESRPQDAEILNRYLEYDC